MKNIHMQKDLQALGNSKEEIAKSLGALGIKGEKFHCGSCPIGQYLMSKGYPRPSSLKEVKQGLMPVRDFIRAFDNGEFPELESEEEISLDMTG
jgi:hypothetical protein